MGGPEASASLLEERYAISKDNVSNRFQLKALTINPTQFSSKVRARSPYLAVESDRHSLEKATLPSGHFVRLEPTLRSLAGVRALGAF